MLPDTIPPEYREFVEQELSSGRYHSVDELIHDGLRLLYERKLYELRRDLNAGLDQLDRGDAIALDNEEELAAFFEDITSRGHARLS